MIEKLNSIAPTTKQLDDTRQIKCGKYAEIYVTANESI